MEAATGVSQGKENFDKINRMKATLNFVHSSNSVHSFFLNFVNSVKNCFLVFLLSSCAGLNERPDGSPPQGAEPKSALVGELLAIFPGILVHGMGHRYAGNSQKADEILTMEAYALLTSGLGGGLYGIGVSQDAKAVEIAGWVGIGVGGVAFLGTWIYDLVYTPSEVDRYNRQVAGSQ